MSAREKARVLKEQFPQENSVGRQKVTFLSSGIGKLNVPDDMSLMLLEKTKKSNRV